ncbi:MAG: 5-histidylcysteine sulfoxide synthase [Myxococcales bacterium]|nr:5-histidylcysteine sulfoxide synthase [Myxococcales bacterium]
MTENRPHQPPRLPFVERGQLLCYLHETWALTDWLFSSVVDRSLFLQRPDPLRNPLVFYLGHPAAFYLNKLRLAGLLEDGLDDELDELLARGVDPAHRRELDGQGGWPSAEVVWRYRDEARRLVEEVVERGPTTLEIDASSPYWAILMALEHERIHFETSSVLLRQAPLGALRRPVGWCYAPSDGPSTSDATTGRREALASSAQSQTSSSALDDPTQESDASVHLPEQRVRVGRGAGAPIFGWDNEFGELECAVTAFYASRTLVRNRDFLRFVEAGGYHEPRYWSAEGWRWRTEQRALAPRFWRQSADGVRYRAMFDELALPLSWPVEVNHYEAEAYCAYRGDGWRLPSEAEQLALTQLTLPAAVDAIDVDRFNLNLRHGSPRASVVSGDEPLADAFGNVWQWLADDFYPLPGFRPHRLYEDFSAPYFGAAHKMMLGGSWASTGACASRFYRLWFRPYFYQHAGFRLVRSAE